MLQDIEPKRLNNEFVADATPQPQDLVIHYRHDALLVRTGEEHIVLPRVEELPSAEGLIRLFSIDDEVFWGSAPDEFEHPAEFSHVGLRDLRHSTSGPRYLVYAAYTAYQLLRWYRHNLFCGRCGHPTTIAQGERAIDCPGCGRRIYPKVQPAVIVGVTDGNRILMTKYANRPFADWALVAGFTEIGETLEQTVEREVYEEVGLRVGNVRYYKSQPWGIASDILAGFYCDVIGSPEVRLDKNELKVAQWFEREDIVGQRDDISLTNEMMMTFKEGKEPR